MLSQNTTVLKSCLLFTILFLFLSTSCTKNSKLPNSSNQKFPEVTLFGTETRILHSNIVNEDFELYISFPSSYFKSDTVYPVLFCLDANRSFGLVCNLVNVLSMPHNEIPEILIVGIGYRINGMEDWGALRRRDFTPTHDPKSDKYWVDLLSRLSGRDNIVVRSGGAQKFLEFISTELIPFIESNYRVSSTDRALLGYSAGGIFTFYTLFQHPEIFKRYFAGSPSIDWDNGIVFKYENEYAATHKDLPVRLFMSAGNLESETMLKNMKKMAGQLQSRSYPYLELETHIFENETHASCYAVAVSRGLKILYK
ncbi:MAG: alpha/beta hydrolase-fold protein [Candidatus Aminicenantes bacterium]|nr:alpha/beta hydrolase-fold protein [Candidatus Aminicenantes bacterium]